MKTKSTGRYLVVSVALVLVLLYSCSFAPGDITKDRTILLRIAEPAAGRMLVTQEYDVTSLLITVTGPGGYELVIPWVPGDPVTHTISVAETGAYELTVVHNGQLGEETVSAEESVGFNLMPYIITVIDITPGAIGLIRIDGEVDETCFCDQIVGTWAGNAGLPNIDWEADPPELLGWEYFDVEMTFNANGTAQFITFLPGSQEWNTDATFKGEYECDCSLGAVSGFWTEVWASVDPGDPDYPGYFEPMVPPIDWSSEVELSPDGNQATMEVSFGPGSPTAIWTLDRQ